MNSNLFKKDKREGVSYPIIDLERKRPCLANESAGVSDTVDTQEEGRRMSRRKKAKVINFLNYIVTFSSFELGFQQRSTDRLH
jgi:hypothetical protein